MAVVTFWAAVGGVGLFTLLDRSAGPATRTVAVLVVVGAAVCGVPAALNLIGG